MQHLFTKGGGLLLAGALFFGSAMAQDSPTKPDNTKTNKQDRSSTSPTADQSKNNTADRDLAKNIRKSITSDKSLSTYAHNVKVIAQHGTVTLRGPVRSDAEKATVEQKATDIAGASNVKSEITVVAADTSGKKSKSMPDSTKKDTTP